jgi:hypothetical protein
LVRPEIQSDCGHTPRDPGSYRDLHRRCLDLIVVDVVYRLHGVGRRKQDAHSNLPREWEVDRNVECSINGDGSRRGIFESPYLSAMLKISDARPAPYADRLQLILAQTILYHLATNLATPWSFQESKSMLQLFMHRCSSRSSSSRASFRLSSRSSPSAAEDARTCRTWTGLHVFRRGTDDDLKNCRGNRRRDALAATNEFPPRVATAKEMERLGSSKRNTM